MCRLWGNEKQKGNYVKWIKTSKDIIKTSTNIIEKAKTLESNINQRDGVFAKDDSDIKKVYSFSKIHFRFKFKNELVQGLGGPYRQFFCDISNEFTKKFKENIICYGNVHSEFAQIRSTNNCYSPFLIYTQHLLYVPTIHEQRLSYQKPPELPLW